MSILEPLNETQEGNLPLPYYLPLNKKILSNPVSNVSTQKMSS